MEKIKRMFSISCLGLFVGVAFAWAVDAHAQEAANADQVINFIGFQQLEDASRIYIRTDVTPSYRVERPDEQTIEVVFNAAEVAVKRLLLPSIHGSSRHQCWISRRFISKELLRVPFESPFDFAALPNTLQRSKTRHFS